MMWSVVERWTSKEGSEVIGTFPTRKSAFSTASRLTPARSIGYSLEVRDPAGNVIVIEPDSARVEDLTDLDDLAGVQGVLF